MFTQFLATFTGDPLFDLFVVGIVAILLLAMIVGFVSEIIKTVLDKLIFHNKKYK